MVTCIVPTIGRDSLRRTVDSALAESAVGDVWVIADGRVAYERSEMQLDLDDRDKRLILTPIGGGPMGDWGHSIRSLYGPFAAQPWVVWLDDDNVFEPGALARILPSAKASSDILLADVMMETGVVLPGDFPVRKGTIDGFGLVTRRDFLRQVPWPSSPKYEGDWAFFEAAQRAGAIIQRVPITIGRRL